MMEDQYWKNIINELTDQISGISIERAVARSEVRTALEMLKNKDLEIEDLKEKLGLGEEVQQ